MDREGILALFQTARRQLEDQRPSRQVGLLGGAFTLTESTPESMREEAESEGKRAFMGTIIEILRLAPITKAFREYILEGISNSYNFGLPADHVLGLIGFVDQDGWGLFEDQPKNERRWLESAATTLFLNIIGSFLILIPDEEEDKMSANDAANALRQIFSAPDGNTAWVAEDAFAVYLEGSGDGTYRQWQRFFERMDRKIKWITEFRELTGDPEAFKELEDHLRYFYDFEEVLLN